jgi:glycosyltransferase involved in cell wall biosynthesis
MESLPVTVIIPAKNEERNLGECLARLKRFARVMVVDSGSTDKTCDLAREAGADVVQFAWDGKFPKKRNWTLRHARIDTPWVFFLDADEFVDEPFCAELASVLPTTPHAGFWINYHNWFLGRRLLHGDANCKLALFRRGAGEYERIEEDRWSQLDMEVHEHPVLAGSVGQISARIDHRDYRGMEHWIRKHNDYSSWEAHRLCHLRARGGLNDPSLTDRQRRKYGAIGAWWLPAAYFLDTYVRRAGFRDGYPGFAYAMAKAIYFWNIGLKVREATHDDAVRP